VARIHGTGDELTAAQLAKLRGGQRRGGGGRWRNVRVVDGKIVRPGSKTKAPRKRSKPAPDPPGTFDAHPPSRIEVVGSPVCVLLFDRVPSLNDYDWAARSSPYAGDKFTAEWQSRAQAAVEVWATAAGLPCTVAARADGSAGLRLCSPALSRTRAGLVWRIYSRTQQKADRPLNLTIKPLCDGLTHAGFWPDDDDKHVPLTLHLYCGVDGRRPRVELEIHALA
jgi:hypothetical protein